jgi:hypothetical protein
MKATSLKLLPYCLRSIPDLEKAIRLARIRVVIVTLFPYNA